MSIEIPFDLAAHQHGLVTFAQLREAGLTPRAIDRRVATGRLQRVDREVFRIGGAPTSWRQDAMAACLTAGPLALASHRTAAALWNLDGIPAARVEVVLPRWQRRRRPGFIVHESKDLKATDVDMVGSIPVTSPVRTLIDLPAVVHPYRVETAFDDAIRRKLVTPAEVAQRFREVARRGRTGVRAMRPIIEERLGERLATDSAFETKVLRLARRAGLPNPTTQHPVEIPDGVVYLDVAWPDQMFAIECDSLAHHFSAHRLRWDDRRQNALVLLGWLILRVTWQHATAEQRQTEQMIRDAWRQVTGGDPATGVR